MPVIFFSVANRLVENIFIDTMLNIVNIELDFDNFKDVDYVIERSNV